MAFKYPQLPVSRSGLLVNQPEPHHMHILFMMAQRCRDGALFVEYGPTNGAVTCVLMDVLAEQPLSRLWLAGQVSDKVKALVACSMVSDRVWYGVPEQAPDLLWIGRPEVVEEALASTAAILARVVVVYDVCATRNHKLPQFQPCEDAMARLVKDPARECNLSNYGVANQHTNRGMFIAELKVWRGRGALTTADNGLTKVDSADTPPLSLAELKSPPVAPRPSFVGFVRGGGK